MANTIEPFTGQEQFGVAAERLFAAVTDIDTLSRAMPGVESPERVDARTLKCVIRPGFSFLRATMRTTLVVEHAAAPSSATIRIASEGIGASMEIEATLRIAPDAGASACILAWEARVVKLKGLITAVSPTLIRAAADQVIRDGWTALRREIER